MPTENRILLENISTESTDSTYSYSTKMKGAGYHKNNNGVHTAYYQTEDFIGSIKIQGTLEQEPTEDDWVDIPDTEVGLGNDSTIFSSNSTSKTFTGRFVWIRAAYNLQNGTITSVLYNY